MARSLSWLTWLVLLLGGCAAPSASVTSLPRPEHRKARPENLSPSQMAEVLCKYQLLVEPVLSRLPEEYRPSELIRQEDLEFLRRNPSYAPPTELDRPGLHAALSRFVECEAGRELNLGQGKAEVTVRYSHPRWAAASLRTPEVLTPSSPTQRLIALVRWTRRNPETYTHSFTVRFERTPAGWRANLQLPEKEWLRTQPPVEVRHCPAVRQGPVARAFGQGMSQPRLLSGQWPEYSREALETRVQGLFIARCRITWQGEPKDCCIDKPLPHLEETVISALSRMRFEPVRYEGEPIDVEYVFRIRFNLPR